MSKKTETSSDEIKDGLVDLYRGSEAKDWKRKSKTKLKRPGGHKVKRVFENTVLGVEVVVYGDEGDDFGSFHEAGKMLFFAEDLDEDGVLEYDVEAGCFVMFAAETFWNRNHYIPDNHISRFLAEHYGVDMSDFDEMSENQFLVDAPAADVIARLEAAGFRHEPQMKRAGQWSEDEGVGEAPAYSTDLDPYYYDEFPYPEYAKRFDTETGEFKTIWTRAQAIDRLEPLNEGQDYQDYNAMSNEELGDQLCLSGVIHDESFGEVIDGDAAPESVKPPIMTTQMVLNSLPDHYPPHTEWQFESIIYSDQVSKLVDWWPKGDKAKKCVFVFHPKDVPDFRVAVYSEDGSPFFVHSWVIRTEDGMPLEGDVGAGAIFAVFDEPTKPAPETFTIPGMGDGWRVESSKPGGFTVYARPSQQAPYVPGPPVTDEIILNDLEEHFSTYGGPYRWEKSAIPDEKKDLKIIRRYDGFKDDKKVIRAVVFSKNESDANQLKTCEDDDIWLFGFWGEEEEEDGEVAVWFAGKTFYEREGTCSDQSQGDELTLLHPIPDYLWEDMENHFVINEKMQSKITKEVLKAELESRGFIFQEEVMDV